MGGKILHVYRSDDPGAIKTEIEEIIGSPFLSKTLGRFVKVTDYGVREKLRKEKDKVTKVKAQDTVKLRKIVDKLLDDRPHSREDKDVLRRKSGASIKNRAWRRIAQRYGSVYFQEFLNAPSREHKLEVLEEMKKDSRGSKILPYIDELMEAL